MLKDIKHVCLDKDGTLIDVHQSWVPITQRRTLKLRHFYRLGEHVHDDLALAMGVDLVHKRIVPGGPVGYQPRPVIIEAVARWLKTKNIAAGTDEIAGIFREVDRDVQDANDFNASALPGVIDGIKRLKHAGYQLSLYTSDRHKNAERVLEHLGIRSCIDAVIGGDDVRNPKPDPEGFISACAVVGVPLMNSVYVGDTVDDMWMARQCGLKGAFGVAQGLATEKELAGKAQKVFATFNELTDYLTQ
jgi:phosphoglycolate phosphatase